MKVLLITLLTLSFLGISVLSFVTMYHYNSIEYRHCAAEMATGLDCPANPFAFADFHLNLFQVFSSAYFGNFFNTFLGLLAFLSLGLVLIIFGYNYLNSTNIKHYRLQPSPGFFTPSVKRKTSYWFSLHENSPAAR